MTLVHGAALQVRRRSSDDRRDDRFPFNAWLAPHRDEVVDAEDCRNSASGEHGLGERHTDRGFALVTSSTSGSVVSSVNFIASGFGVGDGEAVATFRA